MFTPGPWRQSNNELGYETFDILADKGDFVHNLGIATTVDPRFSDPDLSTVALDRDTCNANARLIATAPELLEELRDMLLLIEEHGTPVMKAHATRISKARMAIAKAEGNDENPLSYCP